MLTLIVGFPTTVMGYLHFERAGEQGILGACESAYVHRDRLGSSLGSLRGRRAERAVAYAIPWAMVGAIPSRCLFGSNSGEFLLRGSAWPSQENTSDPHSGICLTSRGVLPKLSEGLKIKVALYDDDRSHQLGCWPWTRRSSITAAARILPWLVAAAECPGRHLSKARENPDSPRAPSRFRRPKCKLGPARGEPTS
jgi:hypothetical protein